MSTVRPSSRDDFQIALVCALPLEFNAAVQIFDEFWDEDGDRYGKARGDANEYTTGRIGPYNVVLVLLHKMGKVSAAGAVTNLCSSYERLCLVLLVGVCGGAPYANGSEMILGDVVISERLVQHDFGRKYPDRFYRKDNPHPPPKEIRSLLAMVKTDRRLDQIEARTAQLLQEIQLNVVNTEASGQYDYPGMENDKLYHATYRHKHCGPSRYCICSSRSRDKHAACDAALKLSCAEAGCDDEYLIPRRRLRTFHPPDASHDEREFQPQIHLGAIASGDTVLRSATDRDRLVKEAEVIAFEMEGAGMWDEIPCLIVKGVCDYADSHKHKQWQNFAAATAASASRAIIEFYTQTDKSPIARTKGHWMVPFGRNEHFIGRQDLMDELMDRILPTNMKDDCQRTSVEGLGGIGKTQIALEAAFRLQHLNPLISIFWVPAISIAAFENAYRQIGKILNLKGIESDHINVKGLVQRALSNENIGEWVMIIDNADDLELLLGPSGLSHYFPFSRSGSILITTRNHEVPVRLYVPQNGALRAEEMTRSEAVTMLETMVSKKQLWDTKSTDQLLELLADLPLAIKQAGSFLAMTAMSTKTYLKHCESSDSELIRLLSNNFEDNIGYGQAKKAIATTWLISFESLARHHATAWAYLQFLSFMAPKDIPKDLLPRTYDPLEADRAIGTLKAYSLISESGDDLYTTHRLVRLATQNWVHRMGEAHDVCTDLIQRLSVRFPAESDDLFMSSFRTYLPHGKSALDYVDLCDDSTAKVKLLLKVGDSLNYAGQYDEAERICRQALVLSEEKFGKLNSWTLESMHALSDLLQTQGRLNEAEKIRHQLIHLSERVHGKSHPFTLEYLTALAKIHILRENDDIAERLLRDLLKFQEGLLGNSHPEILLIQEHLADTLHYKNEFQTAEQIYRRILELRRGNRKIWWPNHALVMRKLGKTLFAQYRDGEAETAYLDSIAIYRDTLGDEHPDTLRAKMCLGSNLCHSGKLKQGQSILRQVLTLQERILGEHSPDTLDTMRALGQCMELQHRYTEAKEWYQWTLELAETIQYEDSGMRYCKRDLELLKEKEHSYNRHKSHMRGREKDHRLRSH